MMKLITEEEAKSLGVQFGWKRNRRFKSVRGIKQAIASMEKDGGFEPNEIAYYFEEGNGLSLCFGIQPENHGKA